MGIIIKSSNNLNMATDYSQPGPWSTVKANWPNMLVWVAVFILGVVVGKWVL